MEMNDILAAKNLLDDDDRYCHHDCYCNRRNGLGDTALALGASALGLSIVGLIGLYAYNNATAKFTTQLVNNNANQIGMLNSTLLNEAAVRQANENAMRNEYTTSASRLSDQITITNNAATSANAAANSWANAEATLATECPIIVSLCVAFLTAYIALWLELFFSIMNNIYERLWKELLSCHRNRQRK